MSERGNEPLVPSPETPDDASARAYGRQLAMDGLLRELLRKQPVQEQSGEPVIVPVAEPKVRGSGSSARLRRRSSVLLPAVPAAAPARYWTRRRAAAAAAVLLVAAGALLLALNGGRPVDVPLSPLQLEQRQALLDDVKNLELALSAVQAPEPPEDPDVQPFEAPPVDTGEALATARKAESDEAARFIEARRAFMLRQLRQFEPQRPRAAGSDDEESMPPGSRKQADPAVAAVNAQKIGRVLSSESGDRTGTLVRNADGAARRIELTTGLDLQSGDRIETPAGGQEACASVSLDGGATLDLDRGTVLEVLGRDELRLQTGRIYASINVPRLGSDQESAPPFSLQTDAGRFLANDVEAEIFSSSNAARPQTGARVSSGKVHLVNSKGHVVASKGQEVQARPDAAPTRAESFSAPVWRGQDRLIESLPFGRGSTVLYSTLRPAESLTTSYLLALSHRGEIALGGIQASQGDLHQEQSFKRLVREMQALQQAGIRNLPPLALGATQPLRPAPAGKLEETRPERTAAALQILACAQKATEAKPLLFIAGGSVTDLAYAWLFDRSIAQRVIMVGPFGIKGDQWWKLDSWSAEIVARNFRCVFVNGATLKAGADRLSRAPDTRWSGLLSKDADPDDDFRMAALLTIPDDKRKIVRIRFAGFHHERPTFENDLQGTMWRTRESAEPGYLEEFDRVLLSPPVR
jgi:hypothetical protein